MRSKERTVGLLWVLAVFAAGTSVHAGPTYHFVDITNPSSVDAAIGESQLFMEVLPGPGSAQVEFLFTNTGPLACSITDVYFDDGVLLGLSTIINNPPVVQFSSPATPADLPGGNLVIPPFVTTDQFSADSDTPIMTNGVNPGEALGIVFDLQAGGTYADVLDDLDSSDLRVGIHVQAFPDGLSESFINGTAIPAPGAALLCLLGAGLVDRLRRRRMLGN